MSRISWGKPRIFVLDKEPVTGQTYPEANKWYELYTPVEDSTQLSVSKGDKMEARIEGGEAEDIKYKRSTYSVAFNIRKGKAKAGQVRKLPFKAIDGRVEHKFSVLLQPEDPTCEGFYIENVAVTIDDTYSSADGGMWQIQMDAIKASTGDTVKWGVVQLNETATPKTIKFTEGSSWDSYNSEYSTTGGIFVNNATVVVVDSTAVYG